MNKLPLKLLDTMIGEAKDCHERGDYDDASALMLSVAKHIVPYIEEGMKDPYFLINQMDKMESNDKEEAFLAQTVMGFLLAKRGISWI
jgi:hypothetical protein